jgi:molybdenum cofactor cytidylyltransferase
MQEMSSRVGAIVLAAGRSSRMEGRNKLLELVDGVPVVARVVRAAVAANAAPVVVVTGHQSDDVGTAVMRALEKRGARDSESMSAPSPIELVHNGRWAEGMSTSIAAGLGALVGRVDAALICLGDMPGSSAATMRALADAFRVATEHGTAGAPRASGASRTLLDTTHAAAWVPVFGGERGNPVLWSSAWFARLRELDGDRGAKALLESLGDRVVQVPVEDPGILRDVDTPEALERERRGGG